MRVLYFSQSISNRDGGEVHSLQFLRAMRDLGVEVIHYPEAAGEAARAPRPAGGAAARARFPLLKRLMSPAMYQSLRCFVRERRMLGDIVEHVGNRSVDALLYRMDEFFGLPLRLSGRFGVEFVLEVNGVAVQERDMDPRLIEYWTRGEDTLFARAAHIVAVSGALRDLLLERGVERDRVHVVHNGVDTEAFRPDLDARDTLEELGLSGCFVIGYVGYFHRWHRLDVLVESFAGLAEEHDDFRLLLVGGGPVFDRIDALVRDRGLEKKVVLTGPVPHHAVPRHIAALDVAVIPNTIRYCSPLKLFEYMAVGRPTITPDVGSIREIAEPDRQTIMIRPGDGRELGQALLRLYRDPGLRSRIGEGARALVESRYTWKKNAEAIRGLLERASGGAERVRSRQRAGTVR
jgi:glycosyltransferase involved in cell wall biosynthesis